MQVPIPVALPVLCLGDERCNNQDRNNPIPRAATSILINVRVIDYLRVLQYGIQILRQCTMYGCNPCCYLCLSVHLGNLCVIPKLNLDLSLDVEENTFGAKISSYLISDSDAFPSLSDKRTISLIGLLV